MNTDSTIGRNRLAVAVALVCAATSPRLLVAQEAEDEGADELVVVTGSRIERTSGFESADGGGTHGRTSRFL